jgi:hypothetical protein
VVATNEEKLIERNRMCPHLSFQDIDIYFLSVATRHKTEYSPSSEVLSTEMVLIASKCSAVHQVPRDHASHLHLHSTLQDTSWVFGKGWIFTNMH